MSETELFRSFDNNKLMNIVKNYRQYKYDERLRTLAIEILNERGITEEVLKMTGNDTNHQYNRAEEHYRKYGSLSGISLALYLLLFFLNLITNTGFIHLGGTFLVVYIAVVCTYFLFIVRSLIEYTNFYKAIGKNSDGGGVIAYLVLGIPFYVFLFFYYRKQMKEEMQAIS